MIYIPSSIVVAEGYDSAYVQGNISRSDISNYSIIGTRFQTSDDAVWVLGNDTSVMAVKDKANQWWGLDISAPDINISWFDSATNAAAAIAAMASAVGFVAFPYGNTAISSSFEISVPVYFADGAYLTIASGQVVAFNKEINSSRQYIFRGTGTVQLQGETSHVALPEWWGTFPDQSSVDAGPLFQLLSDAARNDSGTANSRELLVDIAPGTYYLSTPVNWSRCCHVKGGGDRLSHFRVKTAMPSGDIFTATEQGCRFENIQITCETLRAAGAHIQLGAYTDGRVINCQLSDYYVGVEASGYNPVIEDIYSLGAAGTSRATVLLSGGHGATVRRITHESSINTTTAVVAVVPNSGSVTSPCIEDISTSLSTAAVELSVATARSIFYPIIRSIDATTGTVSNGVTVTTSGTATKIAGAIIDGVTLTTGTAGVAVSCGAGTIERLMIDNVSVGASTTSGISLTRTAGTLQYVKIGEQCDLYNATTAIARSGSMSNISINPLARSTAFNLPYSIQVSIADDTAYTLAWGTSIFAGKLVVNTNTAANYGEFSIRAATTPAIAKISGWANFDGVATALAGTTGTDTHITAGVDASGNIYVENRTGGSITASITVFSGTQQV